MTQKNPRIAKTAAAHPARRRHWWERDDLLFRRGRLYFGSAAVAELAGNAGTPLFLYRTARVRENLIRLRNAFDQRSLPHKIFFAVKANHFPPLLTYVSLLRQCGADCCSPRELLSCLQVGFAPESISYTGTALSDEDWMCLLKHPGVSVNCDSLSALRQLGERSPGRHVGIRINPEIGIGYRSNPLLRYASAKPCKFGICAGDLPRALSIARRFGLTISGLHFHAGSGYLTPQLGIFESILQRARWFIDRLPELEYVNVGGGLGVPLTSRDAPLSLELWTGALARHLGPTNLPIWVEPGDYLVKDAGILVLRVASVEKKKGVTFVGVNGGFNLHPEPAFYRLPLEIVPCTGAARLNPRDRRPPIRHSVTVTGNINEALDIFSENAVLPGIREGEFLAFLNAGAYGASMSSDHCLRGRFEEYLLINDSVV